MRQVIIENYWKLAENKDFKDITVKEIIGETKCSRTTFYRHFEYADNILLTIENELINDLLTRKKDMQESMIEGCAFKSLLNCFEVRYEHIQKLLSSKGSYRFKVNLKQLMKDIMKNNITNLRSGELTDHEVEILAEYIVSGTIELFCASCIENHHQFVENIATINKTLIVNYKK